MKNRSRTAFFEFIDISKDKGWFSTSVAKNTKNACHRVLELLDEDESDDLSNIELDSLLLRFSNLNPTVSSVTLRAYKGRIRVSIARFLEYTKDPINWTPPAVYKKESGNIGKKKTKSARGQLEAIQGGGTHQEQGGNSKTFTIPLAAGKVSMLTLPTELVEQDLDTIVRWIEFFGGNLISKKATDG